VEGKLNNQLDKAAKRLMVLVADHNGWICMKTSKFVRNLCLLGGLILAGVLTDGRQAACATIAVTDSSSPTAATTAVTSPTPAVPTSEQLSPGLAEVLSRTRPYLTIQARLKSFF
jgi:hypothetical protein